jgi:hypothetical protein
MCALGLKWKNIKTHQKEVIESVEEIQDGEKSG